MQIKDNKEPMEQDQPDADFIKMFVGQVPRSMDEGKKIKGRYMTNYLRTNMFLHI